jgi:transcription-repair coupling factor (superfamily II helicase)
MNVESPFLKQFASDAQSGSPLLFEGLIPPAKALLISKLIQETKKSLLVLTGAGIEEFKLYNDIPFFSSYKIVELAAWETLPSENIPPSPDIVGSRYRALKTLATEDGPFIVLSTLQGVLQKIVSPAHFKQVSTVVTKGQKKEFNSFVELLLQLGYERKTLACDKGEFAVRGGIIDLFPITAIEPCRIEFWGDLIETIRAYDPASQKSQKHLDSIELIAAKELELVKSENRLSTIFDYLGPHAIVFDDLEALEDRYASLTSLGGTKSKIFLGVDELLDLSQNQQCIYFTKNPIDQLTDVKNLSKSKYYTQATEIEFEMFLRPLSALRIPHPLEPLGTFLQARCFLDEEPEVEELIDAAKQYQSQEPAQLYYVSQTESEEALFRKKLEAKEAISPLHTHFISGYLSQGLAIGDANTLYFPMTELTGRVKVRRERQRMSYQSTSQDAFDISVGDSIVHFNHGIGRYLGVEKRKNNQGVEEEFFIIEYAEKAKVFIPLQQAHLISKYVGTSEELPKLHTLGTTKWKKQREQTEKAILGYAAELLKMYAERKIQGGFVYPPDSPDTISFEQDFPYIETEDQLNAIKQIKEDMCSNKAADRLICGDVGYGKTEVAMRAAFKAVVDGKKQVAVLVPTTILALQHYETFRDRMQAFGVNVGILSRFQSAKEIKKALQDIEAGTIDIAVGTHRLLSKDIEFKDLGLIIIDEEQRFGVKAKEHLKRLKAGVDCLTMTATPIPRTLYMSLVGSRDLSVISTPPQDRLPIKTVIGEAEETVIQTALLRELNRDGQAFYVHNRVETIHEAASKIQKMVPKAKIAVAHGQMDPDEIDIVFHAFKKGDVDILVATSIVESGVDIPNANTILVENAHQFGISDLYQLRGRVGRWNRRAYAYFLLPKRRVVSEIAQKRLDAISLTGGYGGGLKMAMRDLEMRGAGDILGVEQSGHVGQIGFHLYCKLLKRTIDTLEGKAPSYTLETKVDIPYDARLPEYYVNDVSLRMEIYQRLGDAISLEEVSAIWNEVTDRFGKAPEQAKWLYHSSRIRVFAAQKGYTRVLLESASLLYERKAGNELKQNRKLFGKVKTPEELETKVCAILAAG